MVTPVAAVLVALARRRIQLVGVLYLPGPSLLALGIDLAFNFAQPEPPRVRGLHQVIAIRALPLHNRIGWVLAVENNLVGTRGIL